MVILSWIFFLDIKPQYYTHPANLTKRLGEVAAFDCVNEESSPYASIHWEKNGQYFAKGNSLQIPSTKSTSSALTVRNVTFATAGWYGCVAINPLLPNQPMRSQRGYLTVLRKYLKSGEKMDFVQMLTIGRAYRKSKLFFFPNL